jgi:ABC-2 type transport system permease protein
MIYAVKQSLEYFTANFSPYQHRQVRIIEFPSYAYFAQSFPNTIPYSEGIGFIARVGGPDAIDYVFNTTAHEVAHQWWAHQVIGGDVQGCTMISESLAEYSALMVMEKEYGPDKMRRFLKYELDGYLNGRSDELVEEMPLMLVEDQRYIHYNKGCLTMYALRDYLGEERLNSALARYIGQVGFQEPPYTNSSELLACLRLATPDSLAYVIEDMFETITLFSNRVEVATCTPLDDGRYLVNLEVQAKKLRADGFGNETQVVIDDWIDIGIFGEKKDGRKTAETVLFMEKRHITEQTASFELIVDARPVRAGIDPLNKLIDRDSDDNVKSVRETSGTPSSGGRKPL